MGRAVGVLADVVAVLVFVAIGRVAHDHGVSPAGVASTAWPFLIGLGVGVAVLLGRRRARPASLGEGAIRVLATVAIGMALRVVAGQGTAVAFVLVALAFLAATMLGWRLAALTGRAAGWRPVPARRHGAGR